MDSDNKTDNSNNKETGFENQVIRLLDENVELNHKLKMAELEIESLRNMLNVIKQMDMKKMRLSYKNDTQDRYINKPNCTCIVGCDCKE